MSQSLPKVNAGVHASIGFEFQKHCVLFLILENYNNLKDANYFICLEHHDDFLFCFLNGQEVTSIECYQAKKTGSTWSSNNELHQILMKITETGKSLIADPITKDTNYSHSLLFVTNGFIKLNVTERKPKKVIEVIINEANSQVTYPSIDAKIKVVIEDALTILQADSSNISELKNLSFRYIDIGKSSKAQKDQLVGKFITLFRENVKDPVAAVDTILLLLRNIEQTFNQGARVRLGDNKKRVSSQEINQAISVITTKQRAYVLWRAEKNQIANKLNISIFDHDQFELDFENSFDLFKDLKQMEHQKVKNFVNGNKSLWGQYTDDVSCLEAIVKKFNAEMNSQLIELQKKAALFAAYVIIKST